jgi:hypothetical protein
MMEMLEMMHASHPQAPQLATHALKGRPGSLHLGIMGVNDCCEVRNQVFELFPDCLHLMSSRQPFSELHRECSSRKTDPEGHTPP